MVRKLKNLKLIGNVYLAKNADCSLINGDGRNLSFLKNESVDCIITDHPWADSKANKGGNRSFADYDCFEYTLDDFKEKFRVLKDGCFLVEMIPNENESNFDYLYMLKKMAQNVGFQYYCKVPYVKGTFVSNTGRNCKNREDLMIFSKGKARPLKLDQKKIKATGEIHRMSGTNGMLPAEFNVQPPSKKEQICQSEKPSALFEQLLDYITLENELVVDQFAGSGSVGQACINTNRRCILIEKDMEKVKKIAKRLDMETYENMENCSA